MNGTARSRRWKGGLPTENLGVLIMAAILWLPHAAAAQEGAVLKTDLVRMMTGTYTTGEVVQIVRMSCVAFRPTERDRRDLARLPGGDVVLPEIDRCLQGGRTAAGYRNGIPRARPVVADTPDSAATPPADLGEVEAPVVGPLLPPALAAPALSVAIPDEQLSLAAAETPPRLLNWQQISRRLVDAYRPNRRSGGTVVLRLHVDSDGRVSEPQVSESSGDPSLDAAVLASASDMRFAPATSRDRVVGSWTELPIRFDTP